ncbi:MAG: hypothetical protein LBP22_17205 [Deltaproteobacteria bacterium]|jgi:hypothetical protein|nr:hypothetical protein [Deltaproteobacteria bacterium]
MSQMSSIRCPGCSQPVAMPAETCARCGYNFRTGQKPAAEYEPDFESSSGRKYYAIGGAALALIIILAAVFIFRSPPPEPAPAVTQGGSVLQPAPPFSESPLLRPQVPINQARGAANLANDNVQRLRDTEAEIEAERGGQ